MTCWHRHSSCKDALFSLLSIAGSSQPKDDTASPFKQLVDAAQDRRRNGYRPNTFCNYYSCAVVFIQFCVVYGIQPTALGHDDLGAFLEFLVAGRLAAPTIKNYLSAIRSLFTWWDQPQVLRVLNSQACRLIQRGIANTVRPAQDTRAAMNVEDLRLLIIVCASDPALLPVRVGVLLAFFGYLRLSNIAPRTVAEFDPTRHSTLQDVQLCSNGVRFALKWSKTRQHSLPTQYIPIPSLGKSPLCAKSAWLDYVTLLAQAGVPNSSPLLLDTMSPDAAPISASKFRASLRLALKRAGLEDRGYTPHSLRRGGASYSYQRGVPLDAIKHHGTWVSDSVNAYLMSSPPFHSPVVRAFKKLSFA